MQFVCFPGKDIPPIWVCRKCAFVTANLATHVYNAADKKAGTLPGVHITPPAGNYLDLSEDLLAYLSNALRPRSRLIYRD